MHGQPHHDLLCLLGLLDQLQDGHQLCQARVVLGQVQHTGNGHHHLSTSLLTSLSTCSQLEVMICLFQKSLTSSPAWSSPPLPPPAASSPICLPGPTQSNSVSGAMTQGDNLPGLILLVTSLFFKSKTSSSNLVLILPLMRFLWLCLHTSAYPQAAPPG